MRRLLLSVAVCLALVTGAGASAQRPGADPASSPRSSSWRQIVTQDFIVTGNASPEELKRTLAELTRFRNALARLFPGAVTESPVPTYVVVLRNAVDFQRFQPRDSNGKRQRNVGGYFSREADANLIVLPVYGGDFTLQTIFHEYTHYFVSRNTRRAVPGWLNEGLADFYSTFRGDFRGKTLIGAVPPSRAAALRNLAFMPLRDIIAPRDPEAMWRSDRQITMFYAQSWALVHYLLMERKHPVPNPLQTYLISFARSGNHDSAFMEAFGTDIDGMDKELRAYVRRVSVRAVELDLQLAKNVSPEASPISQADVNALEGRLMLEVGAFEDAERELTTVVKDHPTHAAAQTALARLRLAQDREDEAITSLQEVVAANPEDGAAHYYLGMALERAWRHEEAIAVFTKTLKLLPRNPAPWSGLNSAAVGLARDVQAAAAIQNALQVEWSPSYYWTQALHAMRLGRDDLAARSLATYLELQGTGEDQSVYPLFVRALAAWRAGRPSEAEAALALAEQANPPQKWTQTVLRYLQGRLDEAQFIRAADNLGEQTEARTYAAFKLAMAGRESEALDHFRWVVERGAKTYIEYELARNELNRLKYVSRGTVVSH